MKHSLAVAAVTVLAAAGDCRRGAAVGHVRLALGRAGLGELVDLGGSA